MDKNIKKEIIKRIFSIVYTIIFLIVSTWFWFGPREEIVKAKEDYDKHTTFAKVLEFNSANDDFEIDQIAYSDIEGMKSSAYDFSIKNNSRKNVKYLLFFLPDNNKITRDGCTNLPNNFIKYRIKKNNNEYSEVRSLSLDGKIYADDLEGNQKSDFSIQYWISNDNMEYVKKRHFHGKIAIIEDNYV